MEDFYVEMHRITDCPYTPSLKVPKMKSANKRDLLLLHPLSALHKKLHDILQTVDIDLLQLWARGNACQVDYLATLILEALELWPFTLDILKTMASIPSFRNAVLQQNPVLLETLFNNAIDSDPGFDKYAATCIALLSTPLEVAFPSNAPVFFMRCLERAVQSLSSETIRPVYLLSSGVAPSYLDILSFDILSSLQSQIIRLLSKLDSDDHLASLLCLAVLANFSSRPKNKDNSQANMQYLPQDEIGPDSADRFLLSRKFFLSRVSKTLDLIVIKAITACSQSCKLSKHEIIEGLKLSTEIVDAFEEKERKSWLAGNVRKVKKLREKVLRSGIETKVQCEALSLLVTLSAGELSPPEVILYLSRYLLTGKADFLSTNAIGQCIVLLEDTSIRELMESLVVVACDQWQPCKESLMRVDNALRLISVFTERIPTSSKLLEAVLQSTSSSTLSGMLRQYALQEEKTMRVGFVHSLSTVDICPSSYREARARLHQNLSAMILKAALHAPQCGGHFDASAMALLLEDRSLRCAAQHSSVKCTQHRPMKVTTPKISMFEAVSTPHMGSASLHWRDGLVKEMSRDIDCRYEGIIRMVGEICRDLESRCNNSERPLREEQSRSHNLRAKLDSSERDKAELVFQARSHQSTINALETERDCLANQVEATERRLEELGTSLDKIHQEFDHAKQAAQAAVEIARQQDLVYLATMTGKDEVLEEQSSRLARTEDHAKALEHDLNRERELEANNAEKLSNYETYIETLNNAVSASERHVENLQNELTRAKEQNVYNAAKISSNMALMEELNSTIVALNEASDQNGGLTLSLTGQLREAQSIISELRLQHETYVSAKEAEFERLHESHQSSNANWQSELELARSSATAASEQSTATIAGLHGEVGKLRKERQEWAREFAEAQELSGRLMSLMGTARRQVSSHGADPRDKRHLPWSDHDNQDIPAAKPLRPSTCRASSRAPKRIKRPQDPKTPSSHAANILRPTTTSKEHWRSNMRIDREPLADLGSTQVPGPLTPRKAGNRDHIPSIHGPGAAFLGDDQELQNPGSDEDSFGGGDMFTSTDQQQLSALHSDPPRCFQDGTTTDL